ncbi:cytochrome P450 [Stereum hirsutum FP-91666 SS1]|uniref:cytochrome P450 n=1 Tax=Stereum hirsutum (strain FP-91666) TaxID=721885 RepID=UPI000440CE66|nr:cytochrome P450 [Stereum hirsutum FP-91666 SS1]EIM87127.1 cytochrome P450 [Stereum hirsutum FP-91666 SS1]
MFWSKLLSIIASFAMSLAAGLSICAALFIAWNLTHFLKQTHLHNIPGPALQKYWCGNLREVFSLQGWDFHARMPLEHGRVYKLWGFFGDAMLHISDPKPLYNVLIKDADVWEETDAFIQSNSLFFGQGLLSTLGAHHRRQRKLIGPLFSINHMRYMLPIFYKISHQGNPYLFKQFEDVLKAETAKGPQEVDVLNWITRVALEVIGQGGLGYSFDALNPNSANSRYVKAAKMLFPTAGKIGLIGQSLPYWTKLGSAKFRQWAVRYVPMQDINTLVNSATIMDETSKRVFAEKKAALEKGEDAAVAQMGEQRDIMSTLLKANLTADEADRLSDVDLLGQLNTLMFAAMDTTSSALSRALLMLSLNPEVQEKLRQELTTARREAGGDLDYDTLQELPLLEGVCRETLRVFPPLTYIPRIARKDTVLPLSSPLRLNDGTTVNEIVTPKNTSIFVGIKAINTDVGIWGPDATEWKPERWLSPLPDSVTNARVPGVYSNLGTSEALITAHNGSLTFMGGGRSCIGFKFSVMEIKIVLSVMIPLFQFSPTKKKIDWLLGPVAAPVVSGERYPSMPLVVSRIAGAEA